MRFGGRTSYASAGDAASKSEQSSGEKYAERSSSHHLEHGLVHVPPLLLRQNTLKELSVIPVSVQLCPGCPRMMRFVLCEGALAPEQVKPTLAFAPKGFAVIVLLPEVTVKPVELMPQAPLQV